MPLAGVGGLTTSPRSGPIFSGCTSFRPLADFLDRSDCACPCAGSVSPIMSLEVTTREDRLRKHFAGSGQRFFPFASIADIAVSEFVARRLEINDFVPADRIRVVYNGIDLERFSPVEPSGANVIAICNMIPQKGVPVLLDALAVLKSRGTEPVCQLVGVGPHLEEYRAHARNAGLECAQFLGSRDDVPEILRNAQLTVVPSVWEEAFGLAAAESFASGVPVVASRWGPCRKSSRRERPVLAPPQDPKALADAILDVVTNPKSEGDGPRAREKAEARFRLTEAVSTDRRHLLEGTPVTAPPTWRRPIALRGSANGL